MEFLKTLGLFAATAVARPLHNPPEAQQTMFQ